MSDSETGVKEGKKKFGKMLLGIALIVAIVVSACAPKADPESDFEAEPIEGGKSVMITGYVGSKWEISIPSRIRKLPVTHIGVNAFREKSFVKVTIPDSVTTIGLGVFNNNQLISVSIWRKC